MILQVGKKKLKPTVRKQCWESEMGNVGMQNQEVEGMQIAAQQKL